MKKKKRINKKKRKNGRIWRNTSENPTWWNSSK
jgi:hypothetical protein